MAAADCTWRAAAGGDGHHSDGVLDYLTAFAEALARRDAVRTFCLRAPLAVVEQRLARRAVRAGTAIDGWAMRRASECCAAHEDSAFGEPIDAVAPPADVAAVIRQALAG